MIERQTKEPNPIGELMQLNFSWNFVLLFGSLFRFVCLGNIVLIRQMNISFRKKQNKKEISSFYVVVRLETSSSKYNPKWIVLFFRCWSSHFNNMPLFFGSNDFKACCLAKPTNCVVKRFQLLFQFNQRTNSKPKRKLNTQQIRISILFDLKIWTCL